MKAVEKSWALLPRALARGLEWEDHLGVLTPKPGGLKPDGIERFFWFRDLKVVAIPEGRGNSGRVAAGFSSRFGRRREFWGFNPST